MGKKKIESSEEEEVESESSSELETESEKSSDSGSDTDSTSVSSSVEKRKKKKCVRVCRHRLRVNKKKQPLRLATKSKSKKKVESGSDDSNSDSNSDSESERERESSDSGSDSEEETEGEKQKALLKQISRKRSLIIVLGGNGLKNNTNEKEECDDGSVSTNADEGGKCTSEDERNFMKEDYVQVDKSSASSSSLPAKHPKKRRKLNDGSAEVATKSAVAVVPSASASASAAVSVSDEYKELIDLNRDLLVRLKRTPQSRLLKRGIRDCRASIKALVSETRDKNTKEYKSFLTRSDKQKTRAHEMDYFRLKMSNKEQTQIIAELQEVNKSFVTEKPHRLELLEAAIPIAYKAMALQRLDMLSKMDPGDSEYFKVKSWIDSFMEIPFGKYNNLSVCMEDGVDKCHDFIVRAKETLDNVVYGMEDVKMQVLQMLGTWLTSPTALGSAIAIKGPMGTGKTSLAKEGIAKIYEREFAYIPLGGASDSSYLLGHSYTYEGSTNGRIVQVLMKCRSMNPIIYFDELDKVSDSPRGEEIINVLIHLTDATQNAQFHDRYFSGISLDLSRCLFVFSYNDESKVSPILRDRMYVIQTKKYECREKLVIANSYLLPRIRQQVNFKEGDIVIPDDTIQYMINKPELTKQEDGVRSLKRCLEILHTKLNLFRLLRPEAHGMTFNSLIKCGTLANSGSSVESGSGGGGGVGKEIKFPFTVTRRDVDALITVGDSISPMLSMYI